MKEKRSRPTEHLGAASLSLIHTQFVNCPLHSPPRLEEGPSPPRETALAQAKWAEPGPLQAAYSMSRAHSRLHELAGQGHQKQSWEAGVGRQMDSIRVWKEQVTPRPHSHPSPIYESPLSGTGVHARSLRGAPMSTGRNRTSKKLCHFLSS